MPNLVCGVTSCSYNQGRLCSLPEINVSGGQRRENTCCASFTHGAGVVNAAMGMPQTGINCGAQDCIHNSKCRCAASDIEICDCGSACKRDDTMCAAYQHY